MPIESKYRLHTRIVVLPYIGTANVNTIRLCAIYVNKYREFLRLRECLEIIYGIELVQVERVMEYMRDSVGMYLKLVGRNS